ncbi:MULTISPECIES: hypothetical protein [Ascidiaceihabitans]|uniref:Uncharacterized protein n=1 Tax=Ascidiaceihabitans donghaensis TaxID=1510460 RepID=A0A2R8BFN4_9RHOB|nr:hypothetical protein [Ascidiaceihabitans donghaensis]SPH21820.1 hypothetical protein ASD8599_02569 [Ascidiaceihabitans donghaensis]
MSFVFFIPVILMGCVSFVILSQQRFLLYFGWLLTAILALALIFWNVLGIPPMSEGPMLAIIAFALFQSACAVMGWVWGRTRKDRGTL